MMNVEIENRAGASRAWIWPALLILAACAGATIARAVESTWIGQDGVWSAPANWDTNNPPDGGGESALVPAYAGSCTISLDYSIYPDRVRLLNPSGTLLLGGWSIWPQTDAGIENHGTMVADGAASLYRYLYNAAGASVVVNQGQELRLLQPSIVNDGRILLNDTASGNAYLDVMEHLVLSGSGEILLNGDDYNDCIYAYYGHNFTQAAGHTIRGGGGIALNMLNQGTIDGDNPAVPLTLFSNPKTNEGLLRASNGGQLLIANIPVYNAGGTIRPDGGTVVINGSSAEISGGTIDGTPGSALVSEGGFLTGVNLTSAARVDVPTGQYLFLRGDQITNDGTIRLNAQGTGDAYIDVRSYLTLAGAGEILLNGDDANDILYAYYGHTLTQGAGHRIHGVGTIALPLVNHGEITADNPGGPLILASYNKTSDGLIRATNGAQLEIAGITITNTGGTIRTDGGAVLLRNSSAIYGGTVRAAAGAITLTTWGRIQEATVDAAPGQPIEIANGYLGDVTLAEPVQVNIHPDMTLRLDGTQIVNNGTVLLNPEGTGDAWIDVRGEIVLSGTGEILLHGDNRNDYIYATYGHSFTQAAGHTIRGRGGIVLNMLNQGTIDADDPLVPLTLFSNPKTNQGLIRASNGAELLIDGIGINNDGGTIRPDGGTVVLNGWSARISGGTIEGGQGSALVSRGGFMNDLTIAESAMVDIPSGQYLYLDGTRITNDGTIRINREGTGDAYVDVHSYLTIDGAGDILLHGDDQNDWLYAYYGHTLTQGPSHRIHGNGAVRCPLVSFGTVAADSSGDALRVDASTFTNSGT